MKSNKIKLSKEKRDAMISQVKEYFYNEREEELGDLAAGLIVDFITEKFAPEFYNQGVFDSYVYMNDRVEDLLGIQR
ncbi:DUF2164 domain-containing protein [Clostridium tunisiense]|jgi:uncharacterized protein (DUF2164 family)|uniref:DUF2164 domain-containing protein n=1 Tax=Clostridium tunisiense TaxID=219748 RepID=UPI0002E744B8|nr:DUF2164 domain-containing protein [Clostridium tunisiense]